MDHVDNYKAPKDNDKYDDETKRLHSEGCAPQLQIPPEQIKRETIDDRVKREKVDSNEIVGGVRLPKRLPIYKTESDIKPKSENFGEIKKVNFTQFIIHIQSIYLIISHFYCIFQKKAKKEKKSKKSKKSKRNSSESSDN